MLKLLSWWVWFDYMIDFHEMNVFVFEHGNNSFFVMCVSSSAKEIFKLLILYFKLVYIINYHLTHVTLFTVRGGRL